MKKVTIRDVAQAANLSIATVSRVLSGKPNVSEETRQQIAAAIRETNYKVSPELARSLLAEDGLVYFIMRSASFNVYSQLLNQQMILEAEKRGLRIVSGNVETGPELSYEDSLLDCLTQARRIGVRAVIISGFSEGKLPPSILRELREMEMPVVMINRSLSDYSFSRVLTGSERGAFQAAWHMLETGRRHLLMVTYPNHTGKRSGFERAVSEWAGEKTVSQVAMADDSEESCEAALNTALETDPLLDGILCSSDEQAARILQCLNRMGKIVPDEIELIGFNDNLAPFLNPPISSVRVPIAQIAETALDLFLEMEQSRIPGPCKTILLDPQLIVR